MADAVRGQHPTVPDRRFALAAVVAECLLTGGQPEPVTGSFDSVGWLLSRDGDPIGRLPSLPDFPDASALVSSVLLTGPSIASMGSAYALSSEDLEFIRARLEEADAVSLSRALVRVDSVWAEHGPHPQLLGLAARALVRLTILSSDALELADIVPARALAALVAAETLGNQALPGEEALLAHAMGYGTHARSLAATLPARDPIRLYVYRDLSALEAEASHPGADPWTRYLYTLGVSEHWDRDRLYTFLAEHPTDLPYSLAYLKPILGLQEFDTNRDVGAMVPAVTVLELWDAMGYRIEGQDGTATAYRSLQEQTRDRVERDLFEAAATSESALAERFRKESARLTSRFTGPFLDAGTYGSFLSGHFHTGLYRLARHLLDQLASGWAAERLVEGLADAPPGPGAELYRWYAHLTESELGSADRMHLLDDLREFRFLGEDALERTFEELMRHAQWGDPMRQHAAAAFVRRLDSRVSHQFSRVTVDRNHLYDLVNGERLYRRILELDGPNQPRLRAWMARYDGDGPALLSLVIDTTLERSDRVNALDFLLGADLLPDATQRSAARQLIALDPDDWDLCSDYIDYLERLGDYGEALSVASDWLERNPARPGFDGIFARIAIARMHQHLGDHEKALAVVGPVASSMQAGAMGRTALILADLGRMEEALALGRRLVDRYPNEAWSRSVLAELLWRSGAYDQVAPLIVDPARPIELWPDMAQAFARSFDSNHLAEAATAADALAATGVYPWTLRDLALRVAWADRPDLAFTVASGIEVTNTIDTLEPVIHAFRYLEQWQGLDAARDWIRGRIPADRVNQASMYMFNNNAGDLLWTAIPDPDAGPWPSAVWLYRAATHIRDGPTAPEQRGLLLAYFEEPDGDPYYHMGRYLMGLETRTSLLQLATTRKRRCEIAYMVGFKAQAEGRYEEAHDWYRVAVLVCSSRDGESSWSRQALSGWAGEARSFDVMRARDRKNE